MCRHISLFIKLNNKDSAIFYASKGFEYGERVSFKKGIMLNANSWQIYMTQPNLRLAIYYYKTAAIAKDRLFGVDNIQTIQQLISREEAKQKELNDAKSIVPATRHPPSFVTTSELP